jgi:hypothetical protein
MSETTEPEPLTQRDPLAEMQEHRFIYICAGRGSRRQMCSENALAITKLEEATHWLKARTNRREAQGTEGTHAGS